jgi:hypothetical protein
MPSLSRLGLLALAGVAGLAGSARAQVVVRAPFVTVGVGPGVYVRAPFVTVNLPPRSVVVRPVPARPALPPLGPPGNPPPVPVAELHTLPPPPARVIARAPTPWEFASTFRPAGGRYEVVLEHPFTHAPVKVCFTLPEGLPRKVRANRLKLEFDYGRRCCVTVRFYRNGTVVVRE